MITDLLRSKPAAGAGGATTHWARRDGAEIFLPTTGGPIAVTSGAINTFGAWTAIATPANDFYLSHLLVFLSVIPAALARLVVEFGYGAGPTALDVTRLDTNVVDPTADAAGYIELHLRSRPTLVAASQQIQARAYSSRAADAFACMVAGWDTSYPTWTALPANTVAGPGRYYPSNTSTTGILANAGAWGTWGTAVTVVDPAPNDMLVTQLLQVATAANVISTGVAYQVGYGAAGSETWCATLLTGHASRAPWVWPPVWVKSGERLAARAQANAAGYRPCLLKVHDM